MNADQLRQLQAPIKARYKEQPDTSRHRFHASGRLLPDRRSLHIATPFARYEAGLHEKAGGDGSEDRSDDLLLKSLVACAGVTFNVVATAIGVPLRSVQVMVEGEGDFRGTLGLAKDMPVGITEIRLRFDVESDASDAQPAALLNLTERHCVIEADAAHAAAVVGDGSAQHRLRSAATSQPAVSATRSPACRRPLAGASPGVR